MKPMIMILVITFWQSNYEMNIVQKLLKSWITVYLTTYWKRLFYDGEDEDDYWRLGNGDELDYIGLWPYCSIEWLGTLLNPISWLNFVSSSILKWGWWGTGSLWWLWIRGRCKMKKNKTEICPMMRQCNLIDLFDQFDLIER